MVKIYKELIKICEAKIEALNGMYSEMNANPRNIEPVFDYEKSDKYWEFRTQLAEAEQKETIIKIENDISRYRSLILEQAKAKNMKITGGKKA